MEASAAIRAQLIREIETLPEEDLQPRAIAILKAKNSLSADDAKRVEVAFAARMALQGELPEALNADEATSVLSDSTPPKPLSSTDATKPLRANGRPRKVKTAVELFAASPVRSKRTTDDNPVASTHLEALLPPKSIRACSRSVSRVGIAIKPTSSLLDPSRVWCAAEAQLTLTI
jgi:hypothetical protein